MTPHGSSASHALRLSPSTEAEARGCVHCGLCLPACPTYLETGHEADSPRGRITTMLALSDGRLGVNKSTVEHLDLCLDCRGCETACPSGVKYHRVIEEMRSRLDVQTTPAASDRLGRFIALHLLAYPKRLRLVLLPARLLQRAGVYPWLRRSGLFRLLPTTLRRMERLLPDQGPWWPARLPAHSRAGGFDTVLAQLDPRRTPAERRPTLRVGFLTGCAGSVFYDGVNRQAAELLCAAGVDVIAPSTQACCGAIHQHNRSIEGAKHLARRNIDAFLPPDGAPPIPPNKSGRPVQAFELDAVVSTVSGCGAMLREYGHLLKDDPVYAGRAERLAAKVRDVTEVLAGVELPGMRYRVEATVTYHDACHLAHGQGVTSAPRQLLAKVPGLTLVPLAESDVCCGAAGTYNLQQPQMADRLARRKWSNVDATGASYLAAANVGCATHLRAAVERKGGGHQASVVHPVELVHLGVFGPQPRKTRHQWVGGFRQNVLQPIRDRFFGG